MTGEDNLKADERRPLTNESARKSNDAVADVYKATDRIHHKMAGSVLTSSCLFAGDFLSCHAAA